MIGRPDVGHMPRLLLSLVRPRHSVDDGGARALRERHGDLVQAAARSVAAPSQTTARRLVQIHDGGSMPSAADHFFLAYPIELDGTEAEGGTGTPVVDASQPIIVDVLGHAPSAGDILTAYAVGGRWVAERAGIKWRRITRLLTLQHPDAESNPLVGQCHQRQRFDDACLCDDARVVDVGVFQWIALQTGLHRRPGGTPRDLLHDAAPVPRARNSIARTCVSRLSA